MTHGGFMAGEGAFTFLPASSPWHAYHGQHVDMAKVYDQAQARMIDMRGAMSTIVHDHPHGAPCEGRYHTVYDHTDQKVTRFDENGNEIVRIGVDDD